MCLVAVVNKYGEICHGNYEDIRWNPLYVFILGTIE